MCKSSVSHITFRTHVPKFVCGICLLHYLVIFMEPTPQTFSEIELVPRFA